MTWHVHVEFELDPAKSERCLRQRGFSFADVLPAFIDPVHWIEPDLRFDYGGDRYQLFRTSKDGSMSSFSPGAVRRSGLSRPVRPTRANRIVRVRLEPDGSTVEILSDDETRPIRPRTDWSAADATTDADIARHQRDDDTEAVRAAAAWARSVRRSVGLSQAVFSRCIGVPAAKVRDWESGRETPVGPERILLRLIAFSPRTALAALTG